MALQPQPRSPELSWLLQVPHQACGLSFQWGHWRMQMPGPGNSDAAVLSRGQGICIKAAHGGGY